MGQDLERLFGMLADPKRIYRVEEGEVDREEFQVCVVLDQLVFGPKGYVETLGPTWNLIHDPRFNAIEAAFIVHRNSVLGGDATLGKQYIAGGGQFTSSNYDLEQYSETLGEGRFFHTILTHPNAFCPVRKWLERTWCPTVLKPNPELVCVCDPSTKINPHDIKDWPEDKIWDLIQTECPNYFRKNGTPNREAEQHFKLFKADLLGVIDDYAITPQADEWIELETGDVADGYAGPSCDLPERIHLEVDVLEKALTYRASLRVTAVKILKNLGLDKYIKTTDGLTDIERDQLLRIVYKSKWPDEKPQLMNDLLTYIRNTTVRPIKEREDEQMILGKAGSKLTIAGLMDGTVPLINRATDGEVQVGLDEMAELADAIMKNPFKKELYPLWQKAVEFENKVAMDLLFHIFGNREAIMCYNLEEGEFERLQIEVKTALDPKMSRAFEGEFHSTDSYRKGDGAPVDPVTGKLLD